MLETTTMFAILNDIKQIMWWMCWVGGSCTLSWRNIFGRFFPRDVSRFKLSWDGCWSSKPALVCCWFRNGVKWKVFQLSGTCLIIIPFRLKAHLLSSNAWEHKRKWSQTHFHLKSQQIITFFKVVLKCFINLILWLNCPHFLPYHLKSPHCLTRGHTSNLS